MKESNQLSTKEAWPHAPAHQLNKSGTYMVTAGTYARQHFLNTQQKLKAIQDGLFKYASQFGWIVEAWAVFSNHYHFVARSPAPDELETINLSKFMNRFHSNSAAWLNEQDQTPGRKVWHNFWETRLTHQTSYLARLNYVHQNPVKHGLTTAANQYPYCSARKFEATAKASTVKTIYRFKTNRIKVLDEYEPVWPPK